jgi:GTP pyrophosphokinase
MNKNKLMEMPEEVTIEAFSKHIMEVKKTNRSYDLPLILSAYEFAKDAHGDQKRSSGEPYIVHPLSVAWILLDLGMDNESICAGLLHDVVEDTKYTKDDLRRLFNKNIADLVDGVTKMVQMKEKSSALNEITKEEQQALNVQKMLYAMAEDIRVIIIKLADRLHNMRTLQYLPKEKQLRISRETLDIYAPMADRLGIWMIKEELANRAIRFMDPYGCEELDREMQLNGEEAAKFIQQIETELRERLDKETSFTKPPEIYGRVKSLYSIYQKVYKAGHSIDEIYDKYAVRIITETSVECYMALAYVHEMYHQIPGRYKDYIANPKPNNYRSIHTGVMHQNGLPVEVQIRTRQMHLDAEYGIAAHWKYKGGHKGKAELEEWLDWARDVIETQLTTNDAVEFVREFKTESRMDILVMTPHGDSVFLPEGSIPIDFAYRIHTDVGNHAIGAKINGKMERLDTPLNHGDVCQILTDEKKTPSRTWLNIVKTPAARGKIRAWFKVNKREENIQEGRAVLQREMQRNYIYLVTDKELLPYLQPVFPRYNFKSLDDLYAAIGYGGLRVSKILPSLKDQYDKKKQERNEKTQAPVQLKKTTKSVIMLDQIRNCDYHIAQCCNPMPGDDIVAFITRGGHGVAIHSTSCANYKRDMKAGNQEKIERWMKVEWGDQKDELEASISLDILATDRVGLLFDVTSTVCDSHMMIVHSNSYALKNGNAVCEIAVNVTGNDQLRSLMDRLRKIPGVISVERTKK